VDSKKALFSGLFIYLSAIVAGILTAVQRLPQLPDDIASLKRLVIEQRDVLASLTATVLSREVEIEKLKLELACLKRLQYGRSSEKLTTQISQLELKLEELETRASENACAAVKSVACDEPQERAKPARRPLPEHLPRETIIHGEACRCSECGGELRVLGEDVAEILEYVPSRFKVIRHVRPKLSCAMCSKIIQSPAPSRPIVRGLAGPGLLAHVLVSKYADHLPLYRQAEIYAREGVELGRSTLADWVGQSSALLAPLVAALRRYVLSAEKLHADDTPVPVLSPGRGRTKQGRLWSYVRDDRRPETMRHRRCGLPIRPIAKAYIRASISPLFAVSCKRTATRASMGFMTARKHRCRKRRAGHTFGENSTILCKRCTRPWPKKR